MGEVTWPSPDSEHVHNASLIRSGCGLHWPRSPLIFLNSKWTLSKVTKRQE